MFFPSSAPGGLTKYRTTVASSSAVNVKADAGNIYAYNIVNLHSAAIFVKLYNVVAATVGTTTPAHVLQVPANSSLNYRPTGVPGIPLWFTTGISLGVVTGGADNNTTAAATLPIIELEYA